MTELPEPHAELRDRVYANQVEVVTPPEGTTETDREALREQYAMLGLLHHHEDWLTACILFLEDIADDSELGPLAARAERLLEGLA